MTEIEMISNVCVVTPDMARNWITGHMYARQRKHRDWHVKELANEMRAGRFTPGTPIAFAEVDGKPSLINGQHTLRAIIESDCPTKLTVQCYDVQTEEEMNALYVRFDRHLGRSNSDAITAHSLDQRFGITRSNISPFNAAVTLIGTNLEDGGRRYVTSPHMRSFDERLALMDEYADEARIYFNEILINGTPGANGMLFRRASVVAIALITLRHQREKAKTFWSTAAQDDGLCKGDPQKALLNWLRDNKKGLGNSAHQARIVATAWNAFFRDEDAQILRMSYAPEFRILGTSVVQKMTPKTATSKATALKIVPAKEPATKRHTIFDIA